MALLKELKAGFFLDPVKDGVPNEALQIDYLFFESFRNIKSRKGEVLLEQLYLLIKDIESMKVLESPIFHSLIDEMEFFYYKDLVFRYENFLNREFVFNFCSENLYKGEDFNSIEKQERFLN